MGLKQLPERSCVGCRKKDGKKSFLRLVRTPAGDILWDWTGRAAGRGAYLCPSKACLEQAFKKGGLARSLHIGIPGERQAELIKEFEEFEGRNA